MTYVIIHNICNDITIGNVIYTFCFCYRSSDNYQNVSKQYITCISNCWPAECFSGVMIASPASFSIEVVIPMYQVESEIHVTRKVLQTFMIKFLNIFNFKFKNFNKICVFCCEFMTCLRARQWNEMMTLSGTLPNSFT